MSPTVIDTDVLSRLTPVTETFLAWTVTTHIAVWLPSDVVTVIVAVPTDTASTRPDEETVATPGELDFHDTSITDAFEGLITYDNDAYSPSVKVSFVGERETDSTGTYFPFLPACETEMTAVSELLLI